MRFLKTPGILLLTSAGVAGIAWFIPDGLLAILKIFGVESQGQDLLVQFLSACFGLLFAYVAGLVVWVKSELVDSQRRLYFDIKDSVEATISRRVDPTISVALARAFSGNENIANIFHPEFSALFARLVQANDTTRQAMKPIVRSLVSNVQEAIERVLTNKLAISVSDHLEITRSIATAKDAVSYIQVQQRTFSPKSDWSADWMLFLDKLATRDMSRIYIVMADATTLANERNKLSEMKSILEPRGFQLRTCDKQSILDGNQGQLPTDAVIELFDEELIKLQFLPPGGYVGGTTIEVALIDRTTRPDIWNMLLHIREHSVVFQ